ncbi:MAG: hypothetical protein OEY49_14670 [Candidatus Heimdallarchaeota archaeon]|nr:hypothetical protein [Candidatus Heimdallarchaeota archaeon]
MNESPDISVNELNNNMGESTDELLNSQSSDDTNNNLHLELNVLPPTAQMIQDHPILKSHPVLSKLPLDQPLTLEFLREQTGLGDSEIKKVFRTEIMYQINQYLSAKMKQIKIAKLFDYDSNTLSDTVKNYRLPNPNFGILDKFENAKQLSKEQNRSLKEIYYEYKLNIIIKINQELASKILRTPETIRRSRQKIQEGGEFLPTDYGIKMKRMKFKNI